jgi:hypothetical protein
MFRLRRSFVQVCGRRGGCVPGGSSVIQLVAWLRSFFQLSGASSSLLSSLSFRGCWLFSLAGSPGSGSGFRFPQSNQRQRGDANAQRGNDFNASANFNDLSNLETELNGKSNFDPVLGTVSQI